MSTCFDHRIIQKGTQKPPGWEGICQVNQIDDILVSSQHVSSTHVIDVKTWRWLNCDTDQFLMTAVLRENWSDLYKLKGEWRNKWDLDTLKDPDCV
jgi:hypothetical protein